MNDQSFLDLSTRIYSFSERIQNPCLASMPASAEIHLTNACNYKCVFCWTADGPISRQESLPKQAVLDAIKDMAVGGGRSIVLSGGGEPTLYPHFKEVADEIFSQGMQFGVITNGLHYNNEIESALVKATWVRFSLNGATPEQHAQQTGMKDGRVFERVSGNIKRFVSVKSPKTYVSASMVANKLTETDASVSGFFNYAYHDLGVNYAVFRLYVGEDPKLALTRPKEELARLAFKLNGAVTGFASFPYEPALVRDTRTQRLEVEGTCPLVQAGLLAAITSDGNVHVCLPLPRFGHMDKSVGSLHKNSFKEIWMGERRRTVLAGLQNSDCPPCKYEKMFGFAEAIRRGEVSPPKGLARDPHRYFL